MGQLEVLFQVPRFIEAGLANGTFQRVGGVIVDSGSKQVVAWLRDGSALDISLKVAQAANPLNFILQAAQTATSLVDGHFTRQAINILGQTVQTNHVETMNALNALGQSVQTIGAFTMLTATGQLINLAMTAASFRAIMQRLERLSDSIDALSRMILAEFDRERDLRFKVALQAARDAFEGEHETTRTAKAHKAQDELFAARENFLTDLDNLLESSPKYEQLPLAQHYLIRAMYAEISRIRCFLITNEYELARDRLSEAMPVLEKNVRNLIELWLGSNAAIYFYKAVPSNYLARFLRIQQWLQGVDHGNNPWAIFEIIDIYRENFWDNRVVDQNVFSTIRRHTALPQVNNKELLVELANKLSQAELLIENMERLRGFELEVRTMRLSFDEWSHLTTNEDIEEHGVGLIVDEEAWVRYAHLEAHS